MTSKCDVAPRYTPGSPGWVDLSVGQRVAEQEKNAIQGRLEGYYGPEAQEQAQRLGLDWIVWTTTYRGKMVTKTDLITGRILTHPEVESGRRFVPIYGSEQPNFNDAVRKLEGAKIKTQRWIERTPEEGGDPLAHRWLLCVETVDLETAHTLLTWMKLTPLPDLHNERRVA